MPTSPENKAFLILIGQPETDSVTPAPSDPAPSDPVQKVEEN